MIRNRRALALALVATLALSATGASTASAQQGELTSNGPVTLKATETEGSALLANSFTGAGASFTCDGSTYTGHKYNVTPHEPVAAGSTTFTITPHYTNCLAHVPILGTRPVTITMNGCDYVLHAGEATGGAEGTYAVTADVVCPAGKAVEVEMFKAGATEHVAESRICTIALKAQTGLKGPHLSHTASGADDVDLKGTFTGIHEERSGSVCGTGTATTAQLHADLTIESAEEQGELISNGPVTLTGTETGELLANSLTTGLGSFTCDGSTYTGHEYSVTPHEPVPSGATTLTITPSYGLCQAHVPILGTRPVTVSMNGCDYVLHLGETAGGAEGTYAAIVDIACPEGKAVEVEIFKVGSVHAAENRTCTIRIKAQTGLPGAHLTHTTNESDDIDLQGTLTGIHEEHSGTLCGEGTSSTVKLDIDLTIRDVDRQGELISDEAVTLTGSETGGLLANSLTNALGSVTCDGSTYTGHQYATTPHELLQSGSTTVTVTPLYSKCQAHISILGTRAVTVLMNGCDYALHGGETTGGVEGTYGVIADIACPEGKAVEVEVFKAGTPEHISANRVCTIKIKAQTGLKGAHLTQTEIDISIGGTFTGIHEEYSGSLCGTSTVSGGKLDVELTLQGHNAESEDTPISLKEVGNGPMTIAEIGNGPITLTE